MRLVVKTRIVEAGFASNVPSHSHRALARWSARVEISRNRFNGFHIGNVDNSDLRNNISLAAAEE